MIFVLTGETVFDELLTFDALVIAVVYVPFLAYANLLLILGPVMLGIAVEAGLGLKTTEAAGHALSAGKVVSAEVSRGAGRAAVDVQETSGAGKLASQAACS